MWVEEKTGRQRQQEERRLRQVMDGCSERAGWGMGFRAGGLLGGVCVCL